MTMKTIVYRRSQTCLYSGGPRGLLAPLILCDNYTLQTVKYKVYYDMHVTPVDMKYRCVCSKIIVYIPQ